MIASVQQLPIIQLCKRIYTTLLIVFACVVSIWGQADPVTIIAQSAPPHTGNLTELAAPGFNRLGVSLVLNDRNELSYQVRLKISIEGQGIRLSTKASLQPTPITLSYGLPVQVASADLAEYLDPNNLDFEGYSLEQYQQQGSLPEGFYTVCFTVYDYIRGDGAALANPSCTAITVIRHDPPVILAPIGQQMAVFPQNLTIQWQPRHVGGFPTSYLVQIFEFDQMSTLTPDLLVQFEQPFLEKTVNQINTTFVTPADPPLELGRRYLIRVRAQDLTMQNSFFNDGWSAPEFFVYGEACAPPSGISVEVLNESSVQISWSPQPGYNEYVLRYREKDLPDAHWYEDQTPLSQHTIEELLDATTYEFEIQTLCGGEYEGDFSETSEFTTDSLLFDTTVFDCNDEFTFPTPSNTDPIEELSYGDQVNIGGFIMRITQIEASEDVEGGWNGVGQIRVPWLLNKRLICTFEGLLVNTAKEVFDGQAVAYTEGLESISNWRSPEEIMEEIESLAEESDFCATSEQENTGGVNENSSGETETDAAADSGNEETATDAAEEGDDVAVAPAEGADTAEEETAEEEEEENLFEEVELLPYDVALNAGGSTLPILIGASPNIIAIDSIVFSPTGATLNAFFSAEMPGLNQYVAFSSTGVKFHPGGLLGENPMELVTDINFEFSNKIQLTILAGENSYVSWDCEGIRGISVEGQVTFCPSLLTALDPETMEVDTNAMVTANFTTIMPEWGQFVADMSISPFEVPRLKEWGWEVQNIVFDYSDLVTPASVVFPENYIHPDVSSEAGEENPTWTGFYLKTVRVQLPKSFGGRQESAPIQVGARDIIIDGSGFTGNVFAINIMPIEHGRLGTWAFSLDTLEIGIQSNQFHHTSFAGKVEVPAFKGPLLYGCLIQPDAEYRFSVGVGQDTVEMNAWQAKLQLFENTRIDVGYDVEEKEFWASGLFYGVASLGTSIGRDTSENAKDKLEVPNLQFQDFEISTRAPYLINIGAWEYSGGEDPEVSGFPLTIYHIGLTQDTAESQVALSIGAAVNLVGANDGGFSAEGLVNILFDIEIDSLTKKQSWSFNGANLEELNVEVRTTAFEMVGQIMFYENVPVYGSGMRGMLQVTFVPRMTMAAAVQFGNVDGFRYWFADALVAFNPGLALGASGLGLYGFGGGASYRMKRLGFDSVGLPEETEGVEEIPENIGISLSGIRYVPDSLIGLGIKAMVNLGTMPTPEVFNASLTFEITFFASGGIQQISFLGDARFLTPPPSAETPLSNPMLRSRLDMVYDFENKAFHANLDVFINVFNVVKGAYPNDMAGRGTIHADSEDWYIYIGTPERRIMLNYDLAGLANMVPGSSGGGNENEGDETAQDSTAAAQEEIDWGAIGLLLTGYLDAGTILPDFPMPPARVQNILGGGGFNIVDRDDPRFANAGGLMFGASMEISMPNLKFLMFYASFYAGMGFDVMLRNYGLDARCANNMDSSKPIGINGWYATGQLWAYVEGEIGIEVDMFFVSGRFSILEIGAAAVLQARLPNPIWAKGKVGGYFRILNGLVKGNCSFEFEIGQRCDIVGGSELAGIEVIASTQPDPNTSSQVDVFARPQATFNLPMGEAFELEDDEGKRHQYRPKLHSFEVRRKSTDELVEATVMWNSTNDVVALRPFDVFSGNQEYTLNVVVRFDKLAYGETEWKELTKLSGKAEEQSRTVNFTTGPAPDYIPASNVAYGYPMPNQFNFLKAESNKGYIKLKSGQPYLFKGHPEWFYADEAGYWQQRIQFVGAGNQVLASGNVTYDAAARQVNFDIPSAQLPNGQIILLRLLNIPTVPDEDIEANVNAVQTELANNQTNPSDTAYTRIVLEERIAQGVQKGRKAKDFYKSHLRTSLYNTFPQKMNAMAKGPNWFNPVLLDQNSTSGLSIDDLGIVLNGSELFDQFDQDGIFNGDEIVKPIIQPEADLNVTANNWYNGVIYPYMYQHFPASAQGITLSWRVPSVLGNVPAKAVWIEQDQDPHQLTQQDIEAGLASVPQPLTSLNYRIPYHMIMDYFDYKNKVANYAATHQMPQAWVNFLNGNFTYPPLGTYRMVLKYVLPGKTTANSQYIINTNYGNNN